MNKDHLKRLFTPKTVSSITKGLTATVGSLRTLAERERAKADAHVVKAREVLAAADEARVEALKADKVATRIEALLA